MYLNGKICLFTHAYKIQVKKNWGYCQANCLYDKLVHLFVKKLSGNPWENQVALKA